MTEREKDCLHEAGHCVVAHAVGKRVTRVHVVHTEAVDVVGRAVLVGGAVEYTDSRTPMRLQGEAAVRRFALTCWAGVVIANDLGVGDDAAEDWAGMARPAVFLGLTDVDPAQLTDDTSEVHVSVPTDFQNELDAQCRHILDERRDEWERLARVLDKRSVLSGTEVHRLLSEDGFGICA
jgi:hypothetical protein